MAYADYSSHLGCYSYNISADALSVLLLLRLVELGNLQVILVQKRCEDIIRGSEIAGNLGRLLNTQIPGIASEQSLTLISVTQIIRLFTICFVPQLQIREKELICRKTNKRKGNIETVI